MKEYEETLRYLLKKTQEAESGDDACRWSQAVVNLVNIPFSRLELLKEVKDETID